MFQNILQNSPYILLYMFLNTILYKLLDKRKTSLLLFRQLIGLYK
jgi:hypothetical protein